MFLQLNSGNNIGPSCLVNLGIAEVVGSNPTIRSIIIILVNYGIKLSLFLEVVGQNPHQQGLKCYMLMSLNASISMNG
jgi:hypothetical protein